MRAVEALDRLRDRREVEDYQRAVEALDRRLAHQEVEGYQTLPLTLIKASSERSQRSLFREEGLHQTEGRLVNLPETSRNKKSGQELEIIPPLNARMDRPGRVGILCYLRAGPEDSLRSRDQQPRLTLPSFRGTRTTPETEKLAILLLNRRTQGC